MAYKHLDKQNKLIEKRLKVLKEEIQEAMMEAHEGEVHPGQTLTAELKNYRAILQLKQRKVSPDEAALEQLITDRGFWDLCKKEVLDHDLVEQLYVEERLTDTDLRSIGKDSQIVPTLIVEEVL